MEFDVLIIEFFDVEIRRRITSSKISKRFAIFALIIRRKSEISFCSHLRKKNSSPRNSPQIIGWIYNLPLI